MALVMLNRSAILARSANVAGMSFIDFMRFNKINLDEFTMNAFFRNIRRDMPIYMTENIISNFGYAGTAIKQKSRLLELLATNFSDYENSLWWSHKNEQYGEFLNSQNLISGETDIKKLDEQIVYPPIAQGRSASSIHHILVMPIIFKELLMLCQTDTGKKVRRYYLAIVDALEIYMAYQSMLVVKQKTDKIDELMTQMAINEAKAEEERKKAEEERKKSEERYNKLLGYAEDTKDALDETHAEVVASSETIKRMAKNCVVPSSVPKGKLEVFAVFQNLKTKLFRVACVQWTSYSGALSSFKKECGTDAYVVLLKIKYNANSTMFWNSFCREHGDEFMVGKNGRRFQLAPTKTAQQLREKIIGHCDAQMIESME